LPIARCARVDTLPNPRIRRDRDAQHCRVSHSGLAAIHDVRQAESEILFEGPVDPHQRRVKLPTALANRQYHNPSDKRLGDPPTRVKGQRDPLGLQVAVGERLGKLRGTKGAELVVQQAELTVEAGSDELIFGLAAPPLARLRCGIDHKVLLLQRLDSPNLLQ
jgi:hypothetical protein